MLKIIAMKDGYLYKLDARNGSVGIWRADEESFIISRHKFGDNFLDEEYHWDLGAPYGTAKPLQVLEESPFATVQLHQHHKSLLSYLNQKTKEYDIDG